MTAEDEATIAKVMSTTGSTREQALEAMVDGRRMVAALLAIEPRGTPTQPTCKCGNAARYVDQNGALTCGICPIKAGHDSIRIIDVPALLSWARQFVNSADCLDPAEPMPRAVVDLIARHMRDIIQRRPA